MKKEKTVRTYQRRTKTGKLVTVRQHTAKYDAAEAMKEVAKKKGAGDELETLKKKPVVKEPKKVEKPTEDNNYGFTPDEYKAWYHWDMEADPKNKSALKVEKALKKQMGTRAYNRYLDEMTDTYSARGHNKALKGLGEVLGSKEAKVSKGGSSKIATPNSIEEIAKAGLKRVSVRYGKGDKKSATYYTDGKQVYEPGEDGYLKKIAKNNMVPEARKLLDPPKSRASHKENSMGFSSLDWEASYGYGVTGVDSDAAMRKIDKAARKYLGAKAYKKWSDYQTSTDDNGDTYQGFMKQLKRFKEGKDGSAVKEYFDKQRGKMISMPERRSSKKEASSVKDLQARVNKIADEMGYSTKRGTPTSFSISGGYPGKRTWDASLPNGKTLTGFKTKKDALTAQLEALSKMSPKSTGETSKSKAKTSADDFTVGDSTMRKIDQHIKKLENFKVKMWGHPERAKEAAAERKRELRDLKKAKEYLANGERQKAGRLLTNDSDYGTFKRSEFYSKAEIKAQKEKRAKREAKKEQAAYNRKLESARSLLAEHEKKQAAGGSTTKKIGPIEKLLAQKGSSKSAASKISDSSLKAKGYASFKDHGTTLYISKRGKAVYMKTSKGIVKADRDDYADFVTGHNGLSKSNRKKLESLGWHEHEEY